MADLSAPVELTPIATSNRPLLSALSRWWSPAAGADAADPVLGYESAHPWAFTQDAAEPGASPY